MMKGKHCWQCIYAASDYNKGLQCLCQHNILGSECLVCVVDSHRQYTSNETVSGRTHPHLMHCRVCVSTIGVRLHCIVYIHVIELLQRYDICTYRHPG